MGSRNDGPARLLRAMTKLLPAARREWGSAMSAELEGVVPQADRWSFALGCSSTVVRQFVVLRSLAYTLVAIAAVVWVAIWSGGLAYEPLRWAAQALVLVLVGVTTLGRLRGPLGPVAPHPTARVLRVAGFLVVAVAASAFVLHLGERDNQIDEARFGVPIVGSMLVSVLLGYLAVTADRSPATERTLRWGAGSAVVAALSWLAGTFLISEVPASPFPAMGAVVGATAVAIIATSASPLQGWLGALVASTTTILLTVIELVVMSTYAPARMIPRLAPAALTPAEDLAQSRSELQDPYVFLLVVCAVIALVLAVVSLAARKRTPAPVGEETILVGQ